MNIGILVEYNIFIYTPTKNEKVVPIYSPYKRLTVTTNKSIKFGFTPNKDLGFITKV